MTIDAKLLAKLESTARADGKDINQFLAHALGVCPTCGQDMPAEALAVPSEEPTTSVRQKVRAEPEDEGPPSRGRQPSPESNRQRIIAYMTLHGHEGRGVAQRCAEAVGCSTQYVSNIWSSYSKADAKKPGGAGVTKTQSIIEFLTNEKAKGTRRGAETRAAKRFKVSRSWVAAVWQGHLKKSEAAKLVAKPPRDGAAA